MTVTDANANPVSGVTVAFVVTGGGGSVFEENHTTNAQGRAEETLTLGTTTGENTVEVRAAGLTGSLVLFTATVLGFSRVDQPSATNTFSVASGDINGDGKLDLAISSNGVGGVSILINTTPPGATTASFAPSVSFATGDTPFSLALDDVNGDGKSDLAVANMGSNTVSVLLNTTVSGALTATFSARVDFPTGSIPRGVAFGDFNGDGRADLAVANNNSGGTSIILNSTAMGAATPSFRAKVDFLTGSGAQAIAVGDVNGDGKPDVAVAISDHVELLLNTTLAAAITPTFEGKVDFATGADTSVSVAIGDLNGDGKLDLAAAKKNEFGVGDRVAVLLNTAAQGATAASFAMAVSFSTGVGPQFTTMGDINGDGKLDLVVANQTAGSVSVLLNSTTAGGLTPSFAPSVDFPTGSNPSPLETKSLAIFFAT